MQNEHPLTVWRKRLGKTQDEVAVSLGVSRWMINRIEAGERTPSLELAIKIQNLTDDAVMPKDFAKEGEAA